MPSDTLSFPQQTNAGSIEMEYPIKKDPIMMDRIREVNITEKLMKIEPKSCSICIEDFTVGESANHLNCGHMFHLYCFRPWNERHWSCPNCRQQFRDKNPVKSDTINTNNELRTIYKIVNGQPAIWYTRSEYFGPSFLRRFSPAL